MYRRIAAFLPIVVPLLLASPLPSQEGPTPQEWKRMQEEMQKLREEMTRKNVEVETLKGEVEKLKASGVNGVDPLERDLADLAVAINEAPIPMRDEGQEPYPAIEVHGQLWWRGEARIDFDFDSDVNGDLEFVEQRARIDVTGNISENVTAFLQVQDVRFWGEEVSPFFGTLDDSANGIDMHQAYLDIEEIFGDDLLRTGRQEVNLGSQRLVGALDWLARARAFDGIKYVNDFGDVEAQGFAFSLEETFTSQGTDIGDAYFAGAQATLHPFEESKVSDLDFYVLFLKDKQRGSEQERWTLGSRWKQVSEDGLFFELEGALQVGNSDFNGGGTNNDIPFGEVFAYHIGGGIEFVEEAWKPKISLVWNHASGDDDPTDGDDKRFNTLFPTAHLHNGYIDFTLWENTRNLGLKLQAQPTDDVTIKFDNWYFWVDEPGDVIRGPNFMVPGLAGSSRNAAFESDITVRWNTSRKVFVQAGYSLLCPQNHIEDVLGTDDIAHWFYIWWGIKF